MVNDGFRESFRLLSYDASGYGRSDCPIESDRSIMAMVSSSVDARAESSRFEARAIGWPR